MRKQQKLDELAYQSIAHMREYVDKTKFVKRPPKIPEKSDY